MSFQVDVYQNEYLPAGAREVNAIVTVTASGVTSTPTAAAEVIIIDCSGSMEYPRAKLVAAQQATCAAIDALRDGVAFAVVAGTDTASTVYPSGGLVAASQRTRREAKAAVQRLRAGGGTAIGSWLSLASTLFRGHEDALRHAILLTDGRNEHEKPAHLDQVLAECEGRFVCDCRGVGTDWEVAELRKVSTALLGTVDIVADPAGLEADFRAMTAEAMGKAVADVQLRLWTPQGAKVKFVKQVAPSMVDLTDKRADTGPRHGDYPTGSWGSESRDYHVCVEVNPASIGDVMLAGRVSLLAGDEVFGPGMIKAVWTDDEALSTRMSKEVAHYTGQAELAGVIQEGMLARRDGDLERATAKLGRAVKLAAESGNADTAALLAKVVDVVDPVTGTVRLKAKVAEADAMTLDTRSTKTSRVRRG
ncbi:VWA domain-containing protein [Kutzneria buriramensis]|uniref:von Willebrand factor type A domain-containing protein n=1 Tax=Kutzneria buriramensis TaxID=1045776 RepID=A0A3E0HLJ9_9PSEU|nr:VWA domain-containing protein [Kutzneria buriramensis]REH46905.1 von Willebrand factor type A domain-containing protein [Kutzneria buriramensis]